MKTFFNVVGIIILLMLVLFLYIAQYLGTGEVPQASASSFNEVWNYRTDILPITDGDTEVVYSDDWHNKLLVTVTAGSRYVVSIMADTNIYAFQDDDGGTSTAANTSAAYIKQNEVLTVSCDENTDYLVYIAAEQAAGNGTGLLYVRHHGVGED